MNVEVIGPRIEDKPLIKNLYTFYRYDLMPFIAQGPGAFANEFGTIDGEASRTHDEAVADCDVWWERPGVLFALLIRAAGRPAGFAMVATPPHASPRVDYRFNEFFILNKCRRQGVATAAATAVLDRFRGKWEVGHLPANLAAGAFWRRFVPRYTGGKFEETTLNMGPDEPALPGYFFDNRLG